MALDNYVRGSYRFLQVWNHSIGFEPNFIAPFVLFKQIKQTEKDL